MIMVVMTVMTLHHDNVSNETVMTFHHDNGSNDRVKCIDDRLQIRHS